jgi:tripartite-type tricarboxylate transporter receptor subunit TctC
MTKERSPVLPNLPTAYEQGVQGLEAYTWSAAFLPKGTPDAIVKKLNAALIQAAETPAVKQKLEGMGVMLATKEQQSPEFMAKFVRDEIKKWEDPIKKSGAQVE